MAVNEYMNPVKDTFQQDYVSQYIPLPFQEMQKALNIKQKQYDENQALMKGIEDSIMKVKSIPLDDTELKKEILGGYENEIDNIIQQSGGDLSQVSNQVRDLARKANVDLTRGTLSEINRRGAQFEQDIASGSKLIQEGKRSRDLEEGIRNTFINRYYNEGGGVRQGGDYGIYNLTPRVDISKKLTTYGKEMAPQITKYATILEDEKKGMSIPGYRTKYTREDKIRAAKDVMNVVGQYAQRDDEIQSWLQTLQDAGKNTDDVIKELSALTGVQLQIGDTKQDLDFIREPEDALGRSKKILNGFIESEAIAEDYSPTKDLTQGDFAKNINESNTYISKKLNDPVLNKNPNIINELNGDQVYDLIDSKFREGLISNDERSELLSKYRESEVSRSQQKYEIQEYYNKSSEGKNNLDKLKNTLKSIGIDENITDKLLLESEDLSWMDQVMIPDELYRTLGANFSDDVKRSIISNLKNNPEKSKILQERITNLREGIDRYALENNLKTNAYTEKEFGNPNVARELRSNVDAAAKYVDTYLSDNQNDLTVNDETGTPVKFVQWKKERIDEAIDSGDIPEDTKTDDIKITFYPTRSMGTGKYVAKIKIGNKIIDEHYVNSASNTLTKSLFDNYSKQLELSNEPAAKNALLEVKALQRFDRFNPKAINNILRGSNSTSGWEVYDPNSKSYTTFTFENELNSSGNRTGVIVKNDNGTILARGTDVIDVIVDLYKKDSNIE